MGLGIETEIEIEIGIGKLNRRCELKRKMQTHTRESKYKILNFEKKKIVWIKEKKRCCMYVHLHRNHLQRSLSKKKEIQQNGPWLDKPVKIKEESEIGRGKAVGFVAFTQRSNN